MRSFITVLRSNCNGLKQCISRDITCAYYASCVNTIPRSFVFSIFWPFAPLHQSQLRASQFFFFLVEFFKTSKFFFPSPSLSLSFFPFPFPFPVSTPSLDSHTHTIITMSQVFKRGLSTLIPPKIASSAVSGFPLFFFYRVTRRPRFAQPHYYYYFFCFESLGLMRFLVQWRSIDESCSRPAIALRTRVLASLF